AVAAVAPVGFVALQDPSSSHAPIALARSEVTRHEYAEFINATHRPAAECMGHKFHFFSKLTQHLNWSQPGFDQDNSDPVVCVSWVDANAYVQWLNAHGSHHYRLPTAADWHTASLTPSAAKANISSSFSNWLQDCASGCKNHLVSGRSWQEAKSTIQRPSDVGHDDVGIRLVRESGSH
ncbi:MAG: SUMF1/EgtB/PvdO family nonheme iron enzyme, partial [Lysobacteraceae bacterium]